MRRFTNLCLLLTLYLVLAMPALAQRPQRVYLTPEDIQVGFTVGSDAVDAADPMQGRNSVFKSGFWTPIYVTIKAGPQGLPAGRVIVESTDTDDVQNKYVASAPAIDAERRITVLTYTKIGSRNGDLTITYQEQVADDRFKDVIEVKKTLALGLDSSDQLCLTVGSPMPALRQQITKLFGAPEQTDVIHIAFESNVGALPSRWFGYAPVDLLMLTTGKRDFVNALIGEDGQRKEALAEWVRRGGRLVVSCGRNVDSAADLLHRMFGADRVPVKLSGLQTRRLDGISNWLPVGTAPLQSPEGGEIFMTKIEHKTRDGSRGYYELMVPDRESATSPPLMVRWPYGLGQVLLVAFDVDEPPFTTWAGQPAFWKKFFTTMDMKPATRNQQNVRYGPYGENRPNDLASLLQGNLESFRDVSVISFGWVALFILIYIVIVGPLDYFFLKKVLKRLELTWITFPTVVLVVSAAAYFAAYQLKGSDLRVNKVDLVDIDLGNRQAFGSTWFTVFSPRIQLYTVGVEPANPLWATENTSAATPVPSTISWLGRPDDGFRGYSRARSQSMFHRSYLIEPNALGLRGVPIQVWSTKSFTANWEGAFQLGAALPELRHRDNPRELEGTVTNPLAVPLEEAAIIYGESATSTKVYSLGRLEPGQSKTIVPGRGEMLNMSNWLGNLPTVNNNPYSQEVQTVPGNPLVRRIMFHEAARGQDAVQDTALRYLDQSWRIAEPNVAILYGKVPRQDGQAETITQNAATPTRLWLGDLPAPGKKRPTLEGVIVQDTYVRVFIPVASKP